MTDPVHPSLKPGDDANTEAYMDKLNAEAVDLQRQMDVECARHGFTPHYYELEKHMLATYQSYQELKYNVQ